MMPKFLILVVLIMGIHNTQAQDDLYKKAWLEKWQNSKDYLIAIAQEMPDSLYAYKPTAREMSFGEQLEHINSNIEWLATTYFNKQEAEVSSLENPKQRIIMNLSNSFDLVYRTVNDFPNERLAESVDFFAGEKSRLQILNLLHDHVTHHRGQLIVYLNLNSIKPPRYTGW
ncbi:Uncharacterized damage-inducible protein DinB (forms a four-helix bundle) [Leeuwenhoekiella marinoflava DSM 3653]|uniref:Uncharacterized damage-inducible protein DinB (Forms a four-helix bundle) n=4 Tax=Leeuwenhoekiella marinoflava TaxID=988 RepID=A0ABY1HMH3_9FLAO|nr:putative damage-inducible protein DinB [Leeuwenhoekiella marinoflava]SHE31218.1 Uncharacterized damage-inducible protein DinB (forms a four-helix bundle) [Leeuwenhoekiella marinoflava DSM 3653]